MKVGVGYSEHDDTEEAGIRAMHRAKEQAGRSDPCDMVLLFSTSSHDPVFLRSVVAAEAGGRAAIIGGGAVGAITNDRYGYSGDQVGLAAFWLDGTGCRLFSEGGLADSEEAVGQRLGRHMASEGVKPQTPAVLLYDAVNRKHGDLRLNLATPLLQGLEKGLGFLPPALVGAGLLGDFDNSATMQWNGDAVADQQAMMLTFSGGLQLDSVIMHGCRPAGDYFTVTKADKQVILEIDGKPALSYIESQLHPSLPADEFPFFMIFGVNRDPGGKYDEKNFANRLCLGIDKARQGIVMFESDMVAGTRFQIMYRSLDLEYIPPKIDHIFRIIGSERRPVFAFYIDCAGRAARYGAELEDAVVVQRSVRGRAPLLGIYSGVEIAPIMGLPRTLDWTGVFCLFSEGKG